MLGADALVALRLDNPLVFVPFILMCCFVNLMLGSASAQWAVTAPIFVPMLMTIGYSPEVIQAAYPMPRSRLYFVATARIRPK